MLLVALAIEFLDELVDGARGAALPLIRHDLHLSYGQLGLLSAVPLVVGSLFELPVGVLATAGHRRLLFLAGGVVFAAALAGVAVAPGFAVILLAFTVFFPASGAFVGLGQTVLMDAAPGARERAMARWTLAGSCGAVAGPLLLAAVVGLGGTWRLTYVLMATATLAVLAPAARQRTFGLIEDVTSVSDATYAAWRAAHRADVLRWLLVVEAGDGLVDVLLGFLAVYFVDVVHVSAEAAAVAVAVRVVAGFAGDALLVPALHRWPSARIMRATTLAALVAYPALLVVPGFGPKLVALAIVGLVTAPWYTLAQAALYDTLPDQSGIAFSLSSTAAMVAGVAPAIVGFVAQRFGLQTAMWLLLASPLTLLVVLLRRPPLSP